MAFEGALFSSMLMINLHFKWYGEIIFSLLTPNMFCKVIRFGLLYCSSTDISPTVVAE